MSNTANTSHAHPCALRGHKTTTLEAINISNVLRRCKIALRETRCFWFSIFLGVDVGTGPQFWSNNDFANLQTILFQNQDRLSWYMNSYHKDTRVLQPSYLYNDNSFTHKKVYFCWDDPLVPRLNLKGMTLLWLNTIPYRRFQWNTDTPGTH